MHRLPAVLLCLCGLALLTKDAHAEERSSPRFTVQVDPLTAALGYAHLQVEYALASHHSIYVGPHLRLYDNLLDDKEEDYTGIGIESAYRYFWRGTAPEGPWLQARGVISYLSSDEDSTPGGYIGGLGGYSWILQDRWVLALGAGLQYIHMTVGDFGTEGILPAAHTAVGAAF